jgi:hypothetical protein
MKKNLLLMTVIAAAALSSCKKDRDCECTTTVTDRKGNTTTYQPETITYVKMKKSDAKSLCQKATYTDVNESGATETTVVDCKLK